MERNTGRIVEDPQMILTINSAPQCRAITSMEQGPSTRLVLPESSSSAHLQANLRSVAHACLYSKVRQGWPRRIATSCSI